MSTNTPLDVQIFDTNDTESTQLFYEWLNKYIQQKFGRIRMLPVSSENISNSDPLLVICLNHSRIGTDINYSVSYLPHGLDSRQIAICVLHVQAPHVISVTMPTDNLTSEEYEKYGMLVDFAFTTELGVYTCKMNNIGQEKLESFLERYLSKPSFVDRSYKQKAFNFVMIILRQFRDHKKVALSLVVLSVAGLCYRYGDHCAERLVSMIDATVKFQANDTFPDTI